MRGVWVVGLLLGLVAAGLALSDLPLAVKLLVGLVIVGVGLAGPFGSVLLAGLLLSAGVATFVVLTLSSASAVAGSALGVTTLLTASGVAFSFRELFRDRKKVPAAETSSPPLPGQEP